MKAHIIEARDIPEAWFKLVYDVQSNTDKTCKWKIDRGSFSGSERWDFEAPIIIINNPCEGNLSDRIASNPEGSTLPNPVDPIIYPDCYCPSCRQKIENFDYKTKNGNVELKALPCECLVSKDFYLKNKPTSEQNIIKYFSNYLFSNILQPDELYTYGSRIMELVPLTDNQDLILKDLMQNFNDYIIIGKEYAEVPQYYYLVSYLRTTSGTNQCVLQIAKPSDITLSDPPCLRHIDCKIVEGKLHFYIYFRSWDMYNGFPANLAAISLLMDQMCSDIGNVEPGSFVCHSKSLHLYSHHFEVAASRIGRK